MDDKKQVEEKLKDIIAEAEESKNKEFRIEIEKWVEEGEEEAEYILVQYLTDRNVTPEIRMEFIRAAGYLQRSSFLVPLKKIIDTEPNSRIQQEAIIAVAKFNDRRALNILNHALQLINNPLLTGAINKEISRIKENNPILALLPRFQCGQKSPKTFKITLQVLKRILNPTDASIFTKFLSSDDPLIQNGAYEILCIVGDIFYDSDILGYYEKRYSQIPCLQEKECEELYLLTDHLKIYLSRYQFLIEEQIPNLKEKYLQVKDIRVKQSILSLICKSKEKNAHDFIREIFSKEPPLQKTIIGELSGNDTVVDFLFQLYRTQKELKKDVIKSLLNSKQGLDYFIEHFFTLPFEDQETITINLPYAEKYNLSDFVKKIFQADIFRLKEILLSKVKETYEFSVEELLFEPSREREFFFMGDEYFDTITRVFPVTSVKKLLEKLLSPEISINKAKKFLTWLHEVVQMNLVITLRDKEFIANLFNRIIKSNNTELNVLFLGILKHIKTLDAVTYNNFRESIGLYITQRETKLTPKETGELSRVRRNLHDLFLEIKHIEEGKNTLERLIKTRTVDFDLLTHIMKEYPLGIVMSKDRFFEYLTKQFARCTTETVNGWMEFFTRFPRAADFIKSSIQGKLESRSEIEYRPLLEFIDSVSGNPIRLVLQFSNRHFTAVFREEFREVAPDIPLETSAAILQDTDILLTDAEAFRDFILQNKPLPGKIYLFLENLTGFSDFKAYNTRNFVQPFLYYRIVKEILQDLFL